MTSGHMGLTVGLVEMSTCPSKPVSGSSALWALSQCSGYLPLMLYLVFLHTATIVSR